MATAGGSTAATGVPPVVLAVDGGATKTDVVLVGAGGVVLGRARGAATNHQLVGLPTALDHLGATIAEACRAAGVAEELPVCATGVYCLAGIDLSADEERVVPAVAARRWTETADVRNDTFAVLRAGVSSGWGVGVVCGTGLNCVGLGPDGSSVRFPALGELSGDFAPGGLWLGTRGLGLALRQGDGRGPATLLATTVPAHFDLANPEAVLEAVYRGDLAFGRLAELAEVVLDAARAGDAGAEHAVTQLVDEVVLMVTATVARLDVGTAPVEVVVGGGLFESRHGFVHRVVEGVHRHVPSAALRPLEAPPVVGAALLGLDALAAGPEAEQALRAGLALAPPD